LLIEIHEEIAGLLSGPLPGGMQGDSQNSDAPAGVLDNGEDAGAGPVEQVGREESRARIASA
jgi:hypothetical protein